MIVEFDRSFDKSLAKLRDKSLFSKLANHPYLTYVFATEDVFFDVTLKIYTPDDKGGKSTVK